jgi:CRP-like cAMP-binding protein
VARTAGVQPSIVGLRGIKLLEGLSDSALEDLAKRCNWRRFKPEQRIISREATDRDAYLIVHGRVRVTAFSAGGKQVTFRDLPAGELFGDLAAIDGRARSADIVALEETLLAVMSPEEFRRLITSEPMVCDRMLRRLTVTIRDLSDRLFDLSTLGVQNRLHAEVLRLARLAGVNDNKARIDPKPKDSEIASQISTYREQITRELTKMKEQGLIERDGHAIVVPDVERLERIVAEVRRSG